MRMYDIILKKRGGGQLSEEEIQAFIDGYTAGEIPDYQASALCMAIWFNGMTRQETAALTQAMAHSGDMVDLSCFGDLSVDKHSTGGVGDKTSLVVGPVVAALGGKMAKMSGRGLGHTGGTVDKMESIPGMRVVLDREEFLRQARDVGLAIIGQSGNLTPADKKLYALRDVTATVDSIPLITSSIMSKKLAAGAKNIVLDVKVGSGAFMKTPQDARELAQNMVDIGKACGRNIAALLTNMDRPLGAAVGNSLEVREAIDVLAGRSKGDLREVCEALAAELVCLFKGIDAGEALKLVRETIDSGAALAQMERWIAAQGGDAGIVRNPRLLPAAQHVIPVKAPVSGWISAMDAEQIGIAAVLLGAGREKKEDEIDYAAGIILEKKTGDRVEEGQPLAWLHTNRPQTAEAAAKRYLDALRFSEEAPAQSPLIYEVIR